MIFLLLNLGVFEILLLLVALVIPFAALIDILRSKFKPLEKLIWVFIVLFANILGVVLYLTIGVGQKIK